MPGAFSFNSQPQHWITPPYLAQQRNPAISPDTKGNKKRYRSDCSSKVAVEKEQQGREGEREKNWLTETSRGTPHLTETCEECSELPSMLAQIDGGSLSLKTVFAVNPLKIAFKCAYHSKVRTTPMSMSQVKFDFRLTYIFFFNLGWFLISFGSLPLAWNQIKPAGVNYSVKRLFFIFLGRNWKCYRRKCSWDKGKVRPRTSVELSMRRTKLSDLSSDQFRFRFSFMSTGVKSLYSFFSV